MLVSVRPGRKSRRLATDTAAVTVTFSTARLTAVLGGHVGIGIIIIIGIGIPNPYRPGSRAPRTGRDGFLVVAVFFITGSAAFLPSTDQCRRATRGTRRSDGLDQSLEITAVFQILLRIHLSSFTPCQVAYAILHHLHDLHDQRHIYAMYAIQLITPTRPLPYPRPASVDHSKSERVFWGSSVAPGLDWIGLGLGILDYELEHERVFVLTNYLLSSS